MRIIVLSRELPPVGGGAGNFAINICRGLATEGHSVTVVTMHIAGLAKIESLPEGVKIYRLGVFRRDRSNCGIAQMVLYILRAIIHLAGKKTKGVDFIYAQSIVPEGFIAWLISKTKGIPYFITAHGSDVPGYNTENFQIIHRLISPLWKNILRNAVAISTPSLYLKKLIQMNYEHAKMEVIPYGYDTERYSFIPEKKKIILIVSRLEPRKNYTLFFEAINEIETKSPSLLVGFKIFIVGDGTEKSRLMELSTELKTSVRFLGWIPNESKEMKTLFEEASIFVYPSKRENFPVALLEAMSAGLAIITTKGSGCQEVVGDCAKLVWPDSVDDMSNAIRRLLESPDEVKRLQGIAARSVREKYSWSRVLERYIAFFKGNLAWGRS
jgi:glycosyltransferase involved in cell wall biosynthesis